MAIRRTAPMRKKIPSFHLVLAGALALLSCVLCFSFSVDAVLPGFKASITQYGLDYAHTQGLKYLRQRLADRVISVPDQTGSQDTFDYWITAITISKITVPDGSISFVPGVGLAINTQSLGCEFQLTWKVREQIWPNPEGYGNAIIDLTNTIARTTVVFGLTANGQPTASAQDTVATIGGVNVNIYGSNLDVIKAFLEQILAGIIQSVGPVQIATEINHQVDVGFSALLASLPTTFKIGTVAELDYSLVAAEEITASYMMLPMKGEFYAQAAHAEAPFQPPQVADPTGGGDEMQLYFTSYVPNTAMYVYYKAGALNTVVTAADVPATSPITFNTSSWTSIIPQLYKAFPNWAMQMTITALAPPTVSFSVASGVQVNAQANLSVQVVSPKDGKISTAFVAAVTAVGDANIAMVQNNVTGKVTFFNISMTIAQTFIGQFNPTQFEGIAMFVAEGIVMPQINSYLAVGVPVPVMDQVKLVNPSVSIQNGYLEIATNFYYPDPSSTANHN